jgi:chemotaxis protein CheD
MPAPSLTGFEHKVVVGVGDMAVSNNPDLTLATYSLGSCLGVVIFDPVARVGGLLHAMLPDSNIDTAKAAARPGMFIDTGVPAMFRAAYQLRADKRRVRIYVIGGAQIMDNSGFFNIGKRNCEALDNLLAEHQLMITAKEIGGLQNRTVFFRLNTGQVTLKMSGQQTEVPL